MSGRHKGGRGKGRGGKQDKKGNDTSNPNANGFENVNGHHQNGGEQLKAVEQTTNLKQKAVSTDVSKFVATVIDAALVKRRSHAVAEKQVEQIITKALVKREVVGVACDRAVIRRKVVSDAVANAVFRREFVADAVGKVLFRREVVANALENVLLRRQLVETAIEEALLKRRAAVPTPPVARKQQSQGSESAGRVLDRRNSKGRVTTQADGTSSATEISSPTDRMLSPASKFLGSHRVKCSGGSHLHIPTAHKEPTELEIQDLRKAETLENTYSPLSDGILSPVTDGVLSPTSELSPTSPSTMPPRTLALMPPRDTAVPPVETKEPSTPKSPTVPQSLLVAGALVGLGAVVLGVRKAFR